VGRSLRWLNRLLVVGPGAFVAFWIVCVPQGRACGQVPCRVRGVVVDATTGTPLGDVALLQLWDPAVVDDAERLALRRRRAYESRPEDDRLFFRSTACGHTGADGAFTLVVGLPTTYSEYVFWTSRLRRGSPFHAARALLVEKEGYCPLVRETNGATWREEPDGEIVGTFDVGTIRLQPR